MVDNGILYVQETSDTSINIVTLYTSQISPPREPGAPHSTCSQICYPLSSTCKGKASTVSVRAFKSKPVRSVNKYAGQLPYMPRA